MSTATTARRVKQSAALALAGPTLVACTNNTEPAPADTVGEAGNAEITTPANPDDPCQLPDVKGVVYSSTTTEQDGVLTLTFFETADGLGWVAGVDAGDSAASANVQIPSSGESTLEELSAEAHETRCTQGTLQVGDELSITGIAGGENVSMTLYNDQTGGSWSELPPCNFGTPNVSELSERVRRESGGRPPGEITASGCRL